MDTKQGMAGTGRPAPPDTAGHTYRVQHTPRPRWEELLPTLSPERRALMGFFYESLPESDLDCYPPQLPLRFADHALYLRRTASWCAGLDEAVFRHYVAFPRVNDEDLSFHRDAFYYALWPRIQDLPTIEDKILEVNRWCCEHASYQAQDERTASPLTVYRCGSGRCGEESAFLVSALRSVGIPARQVYAPFWSHCDDNHAWVEALCSGQWRYLGACEPEPVLDRGWFDTAASRAMLVRSPAFGRDRALPRPEVLGRADGITWLNQTARYAQARPYTFQVLSEGRPAAGARLYLQILNGAAFHTIAVLTANRQGIARAALGVGSLHVLAVQGRRCAEGMCGEEGLVLHLSPPEHGDTPWTDFDFHAPTDSRPAPAPLSGVQKAQRRLERQQGAALRRSRLDNAFQPGRKGCEDLLRAARGNCGEIRAFLSGEGGWNREALVRTLSDKDLRDTGREVLEDHLAHLPPWRGGLPEEIYWRYTACPRIGLEKLTPWRGALARWLEGWKGTPVALWRRINRELETRPPAYGNLYWPPEAALAGGGCDERSKRLLLVAALRTLGVPARLRPLDGAVEYWSGGVFRPVRPEKTALLRLTCPGGTPRRGQDWSLSHWTGKGWTALAPEEDWRDGTLSLTLPAGRYRLITAVRLPCGDQLAAHREVDLEAGAEQAIPLRLRPLSAGDLCTCQTLPAVPAQTLSGAEIPDLFRMGDGPVLALWLEAGDEPTEHLLNELARHQEALPVRPLFLVRDRKALAQPTLAGAVERLEGAQALLCDWDYELEAVARRLGRDPDTPPLMVLCDGAGRAVYSDSGYRVGAVELLLRAAGVERAPELLTNPW